MAVRDALSKKFEEWIAQNREVESVYDRMRSEFPAEARKEYRDAATKAENMAEAMRAAAEKHEVSDKYRQIWSTVPAETRRQLARLYKDIWNTPEGRELRNKLIQAAVGVNISKLYYYAAHGMYDQLAKELGVSPSDVPHNFAGAASLVAAVKGIKEAYKKAWI